ncbi:MAG: tetratricopeptide repeat protein [Acidobacteriota bacterium]
MNITILRGPQATLQNHPAIASITSEYTFHLEVDAKIPWAAARRLLALMRARLGNEVVEKAILPHRALLSLVLRRLVAQLTEEEQRIREENSALKLGLLPNTALNPRPLIEAWADLFSELIGGHQISLIFPNIACLDLESIHLVRPLLRRKSTQLTLVFGCDPTISLEDNLSARIVKMVESQLKLLETLPDTSVEVVTEGGSTVDGNREIAALVDPLDDELERIAWQTLADPRLYLQSPRCKQVFNGIYAAFEAFGFATTLRLISRLTKRFPTKLPEAARLHMLAGLAAHNLAPLTNSEDELSQLAEKHFSIALEKETIPAQRVQILYRLSLLAARSEKDFDLGLSLAEKAFEELLADPLPAGQAAFYEAWVRNARAYTFFQLGRLTEARADCEAAIELLREQGAQLELPAVEITITRLLLLNNLSRLAKAAGDQVQVYHWQHLCDKCKMEIPSIKRPSYQWLSFQTDVSDLMAAVRHYTVLLDEAKHELNPQLEMICAHSLGDLYYRLGDPWQAFHHCQNALRIRRIIEEDSPDEIFTEELNCGLTAYRAGQWDVAEANFRRLLINQLCAEPACQAEVLAALAMVTAQQGDARRAEHFINEASVEAHKDIGSDILFRVMHAAGETQLVLKRRDKAIQAFQLALSLADEEDTTIAPEELLGVLAGLQECGNNDLNLLVKALLLLPAALHSANTWWELPRLLPKFTLLAELGYFASQRPEQEELAAALHKLIAAGGQRLDCREEMERLCACLAYYDFPY